MTAQSRVLARSCGLALSLLVTASALAAQGPAAPSAPAVLSAADAAPLVGDWTIATESPNGALAFALTVKVDDGKPVAQISSDIMAQTTVTAITKDGANVMLSFSFDYQGNAVPTVVTLTPDGATLKAFFDFANGAFTMPGLATRKKV